MGYFIAKNVNDLCFILEKRLDDLYAANPYINSNGIVLLVKCKSIMERDALLTNLICDGFNFKGVSNKNGLWIRIAETGVYIESTKSLFVKCKHPSYDEIYIHTNKTPSDKFINMLKENNVKYKCIKTYCYHNEHVINSVKNNKNDVEKVKKEIPEVLKGLEISDDLHSFSYTYGSDNESGKISFYTSEEIDKEKLEELIKLYFQ